MKTIATANFQTNQIRIHSFTSRLPHDTTKFSRENFKALKSIGANEQAAISNTRLQLKGLCAGDSLRFLSLGWIKIIQNSSCLHPLEQKGKGRAAPELCWDPDLQPCPSVHVKTTSLRNQHICPPLTPPGRGTHLTSGTVMLLGSQSTQPGTPQIYEHQASLWQVFPTVSTGKLQFCRLQSQECCRRQPFHHSCQQCLRDPLGMTVSLHSGRSLTTQFLWLHPQIMCCFTLV